MALASGERARCGGRVVKNVTGYDLIKLHSGAFGTLGVLEEAWLRLRPRPEERRVLHAWLPEGQAGLERAAAAARQPAARAVVVVDPALARQVDDAGPRYGRALLVVELGGAPELVRDGGASLADLEPVEADAELLDRIAALQRLPDGHSGLRFRVVVRPARIGAAAERLARAGASLLVWPGAGFLYAGFPLYEGADELAVDAAWRAARARGTGRRGRLRPGSGAALGQGGPRRVRRSAGGAAADAHAQATLRPGGCPQPGALRGEDLMGEGAAPLAELHPGTLDCVHCGLCLPVCPTYRETGRETSSPRGRVYLLRGVAEGEIPLGDVVAEEAALCLGCRACETACPSGVRFGSLIERARARVTSAGLRDAPARRLERFALRQLVPHPVRDCTWRWDWSAWGSAWAWTGPCCACCRSGCAAWRPGFLRVRERRRLPRVVAARGERRGRVALLEGCIMPELFGAVNAATARVLACNGFEVVQVAGQGCCGALQAHAGDEEFARGLLEHNARAFAAVDGLDAIVVNSAGCGAFLREAGDWLGPAGERLAARVRDVSEFLDEAGAARARGRAAAARLL